MKCYLDDDVDTLIEEGYAYYRFGKNRQPPPVFPPTSPWECDPEAHKLIVRLRGSKSKSEIVDGKLWLRENIDLKWEVGQLNNAETPYSQNENDYDPEKKWFCHLHTTFSFAGHEIHVDYLRRRTYGPLSGFEELRFYVDGVFVARGGMYVVGPAGRQKNSPAAFIAPDFAIIEDRRPGSYDFIAWHIKDL